MPHNPPPTVQAGLALVDQPIDDLNTGRTDHCVFGLRNAGALTALAIANAFQAAWNAEIAPALHTSFQSTPPTVKLGDGTRVPGVAMATGVTVAGTVAAAVVPPQVQMLLKKVTAFAGKKNRGRTFLPGALSDTNVDAAGNITGGTVLTDFQEGCTDVLEALSAAGCPMVIVNRTVITPLPPLRPFTDALLTGHDVTQWGPELKVATQRRRLRG
jgi:hypothetical protein